MPEADLRAEPGRESSEAGRHPPKEPDMDVEVIVETPQGSRNKYKIDPKSGRIRLDRMLFTSTVYPLDYGKIPDTLAEDGDPLDMLIWLEEPTFPGCLVTVRPVAVFWMADERGPDAKLLGVAAHDVRKSRIRDLEDVPRHLLNEIGHFFDIYKELEPGKSTDVRGWMDRAEAERVIREAVVSGGKGTRAGLAVSGSVPGQRAVSH
jgi:inorganic pyrophosphatase